MDQDTVIEILEVAGITAEQAKRILDHFYDPEWGSTLPNRLRKFLEGRLLSDDCV